MTDLDSCCGSEAMAHETYLSVLFVDSLFCLQEDDSNVSRQPFMEQPLCSYYGHTADVLDLSWSKVQYNYWRSDMMFTALVKLTFYLMHMCTIVKLQIP